MFLVNCILQNIFLLKPNMYIGNIPLAFPQPPVGWLHLLPCWKAHSTFRTSPLCTWKWNPNPCSFRRQREGSSGSISSVDREGLSAGAPQEQEGHQGRTQHQEHPELSCLILLLHWMHKYLNQGQDYSYKAYFKGKLDPGQDMKEFWKPQKTVNHKFVLKLLRKRKINLAQIWHLPEEAFKKQ